MGKAKEPKRTQHEDLQAPVNIVLKQGSKQSLEKKDESISKDKTDKASKKKLVKSSDKKNPNDKKIINKKKILDDKKNPDDKKNLEDKKSSTNRKNLKDSKSEPSKGEKKLDNNRSQKIAIFSVIYLFLGIFVFMIGYFAYYIVFQSPNILNSAYNRRHDVLAKQVVKGKIYSSNMEVLAETLVNEEGIEYRHYPYGPMFVHVIGRERKGRTGLEETENITLLTSSINSFETMYNDLTGTKSIGDNLITTLDAKLQQVAYDALGDNRGAVVAMEPSTGKILAMVSKPTYDPASIDEQWDDMLQNENGESSLINRATQGLYPPGSTFKLVTALAYMRDNPDYLDFEYRCTGSIEYKGMTIRCYNHNAHGKVSLMQAMAKSCNTSFAYIGQNIDMTRYRQVAESLLFNRDLPLAMASNKSKFELEVGKSSVKESMQTAIGQGKTLITPMQNLMIVSAIANGGAMMRPYLVDRIVSGEGNLVKQNFPMTYSEPISTSEAAYLSGLMNEVVQRGTGTKLKNLSVKVAGKTGSADTEGNKAHAWFVGFAPVDNPKIAICVIVENKGTGSDYAVPVAEKVLKQYFID